MFIDTHTHIYLDAFNDDRVEMLQRARDNFVDQFYLPNIDLESIKQVKNVIKEFPKLCKPMMGLHPCSVKSDFPETLELIRKELEAGEYIAVGEIGVDLYWDRSTMEEQIKAFRTQIKWALEFDLPIVIHSRDSLDLTIELVGEMQNGRLKGVFHCFTGSVAQSNKIVDLGFYMGIGGVLTFKNAGLDKTVSDISLEHLILETDAPYLSPVPFRGKRNESGYLLHVASKLAELKDISLAECGKITSENAIKLFEPAC